MADLSGNGARLYGGRWNSPGVPVLYTASSRSLAALELLVHTSHQYVPDDLYLITIQIPENTIIETIGADVLNAGVKKRGIAADFQQMGDDWVKSRRSLVLKVPSVIIPEEHNYLINPLHTNAIKVSIIANRTFEFDKRLMLR